MSTIIGPISAEDLLSMPNDGMDRELIRGELRETSKTYRGQSHSYLMSRISQLLLNWLEQHPTLRGSVFSGEVAVRLCRNPDTAVGIDIAYFTEEVLKKTQPGQFFTEGPPVLAVEVMSPSDTTDGVADKVQLYLEYGVAIVWVVHPRFKTITVHRASGAPRSFDLPHDLESEPELPGFRVPMTEIFKLIVGGPSL
jgi:Uma2 family endonuclease